ncbi:Acg family FMN-binding oxidoreductase [Streptomyces sp. NPDC014802]|uniref:Acg family FMN-binding oxidoreductase n=1 Tax=Streptomyces sp. NPDC014802 TaxID=3364917 RepID=UPI00370146ED
MTVQRPDQVTVTALVSASTTAPSLHNTQPWRFRYLTGSHTVELRGDAERTVPRLDPDRRSLHLGCGAALFNLRVAAAHAGWTTDVRPLPDPGDPHLLAAVRLGRDGPPDAGLARLYEAIPRRHTSRYPFDDRAVPEEVRAGLQQAAAQEGAALVFPHAWHVAALLDHVRDAEGRDLHDPQRVADVRRWMRIGAEAEGSTDGIPDVAFGPRRSGGRAPVRDFAGRESVPDRPTAVFESVPHLALLGTTDDRPADWLRAGQALERVLLLATLHGLATSLTSHSLERRDLRELARDPGSAMGFVHMVLRLGYGRPGPVTPRRPVAEVLEVL